jgi:hypothetical protein
MSNAESIKIVVKGLREKQGEEIAHALSRQVNGYLDRDYHEKLKEEMEKANLSTGDFTVLALVWIKKLSELHEEGRFDGRNEAACGFGGRTMKEVPEIEEYFRDESPKTEYAMRFADEMSRDHRTLQQSVTKLLHKWIELYSTESSDPEDKIAAKVLERVPKEYCWFPFI